MIFMLNLMEMRGFTATPGAVHVNAAHGHARRGLHSPQKYTTHAKIARTARTMLRETLYTMQQEIFMENLRTSVTK